MGAEGQLAASNAIASSGHAQRPAMWPDRSRTRAPRKRGDARDRARAPQFLASGWARHIGERFNAGKYPAQHGVIQALKLLAS
jgi:hypothetical protein